MKRSRYSWWFAVVATALTITALTAYREINADTLKPSQPIAWIEDSVGVAIERAVAASASPAWSEVYASDDAWRAQHARYFSLGEVRARGDGRRSPRQQMQDRVFARTRAGERGAAIRELERWVRSNPRDADALLWLARLHNEAGSRNESVRRYRQALGVVGGGGRR